MASRDDLFPADEAIRYYNRTRSQYPNAPVSLFFGDFGHMRAVNKPAEASALDAAQNAWFDYYVKGGGSQPFQGVTAYTLTCPKSSPLRRTVPGRQLGGPPAWRRAPAG